MMSPMELQRCFQIEGHICIFNNRKKLLKDLCASKKRILEIGFNCGHSSELMLFENPECHIVSFDIGTHEYIQKAKEYIDYKFPGRHELILGDSNKTIPTYNSCTFDFILIDGGHNLLTVYNDIKNCKRLADENTIILVDDYHKKLKNIIGVVLAWDKCVKDNIVEELGTIEDEPERYIGGMVYGSYKFKNYNYI